MQRLGDHLRTGAWGLARARTLAAEIAPDPPSVRALLRELFADDVEVRKRAADIARRITERDPSPLFPYADELAGLLESLPPGESRARWHLGPVVPRVAHTRAQRLRAARILSLLAEDESNVVRCSAVEGLGALALADPTFCDDAETLVAAFLRDSSTLAMKSRARAVRTLLRKRYAVLE